MMGIDASRVTVHTVAGSPAGPSIEERLAVLEVDLAAAKATAAEAQAVAKALVDKGVITAKDITDAAVAIEEPVDVKPR